MDVIDQNNIDWQAVREGTAGADVDPATGQVLPAVVVSAHQINPWPWVLGLAAALWALSKTR